MYPIITMSALILTESSFHRIISLFHNWLFAFNSSFQWNLLIGDEGGWTSSTTIAGQRYKVPPEQNNHFNFLRGMVEDNPAARFSGIQLCHAAFWWVQYFGEEVKSWETRGQLIVGTFLWELRWVARSTVISITWQIMCWISACAERTESGVKMGLGGLSELTWSFWCILIFRPFLLQ